MTKNQNFRRVRDMLTAARAAMTDADRALVREHIDGGNRERAVFFAIIALCERFCDEINAGRDKLRTTHDPAILARVELLEDAVHAVNLTGVGAVIDLLITKRVGMFMLPDPTDTGSRNDGIVPLGPDMRSANDVFSCVGAKLFKRNGAFFQTIKRGFSTVTEEALVVRLLPLGAWDLDPQAKAEEAAELEVEYAERALDDVQRQCEAEPGDRISEQLAEDRRSCAVRVFDAHLKRRLVQLNRSDLAWQYECGEIPIHPYDDRGPVEIAEALAAEALAA